MPDFQSTLYVWFPDLRPAQDLTDEQRLLQKLRINYDPAVRPVYDAKNPVVINLGITLTQIIDVVSFAVVSTHIPLT